jgi:exonuclease III
MRRNTDIEIGTCNMRSLYKIGALNALIMQLEKYRISTTSVQETRWLGSGMHNLKKHSILYSGKERGSHEFGVAFIIGNSMGVNIMDFQPVSERVAVLRIRMKFGNMYIINVHAPTEEKAEHEKDTFYQDLDRTVDSLPSNDVKLVLGDFNVKVGMEAEHHWTVGPDSLHNISNDNGVRLIDFSMSKNMTISLMLFPHLDIHKRMWTSPDGNSHNQIDRVLTDKRRATGILDVRTLRGAEGGSDHYLVRIKYRSCISVVGCKNQHKVIKFNMDGLKSTEIR